MHATIINDCKDDNAKGRQVARTASLLQGPVSFVGVGSDLEAAGNLIDVLDAYGEAEGVILVNVAPRSGKAKQWPNGTPFGYFRYNNVLVLASIDGLTLSLVKKLAVTESVTVLDIPTVVTAWQEQGGLESELATHIINTQFRSYDFLPCAAAYLLQQEDLPGQSLHIADVEDAPAAIWFVDNFGNCKTTLTQSDLTGKSPVETRFGALLYYDRLKDVPDHTAAIITGSSGLCDKRFLELVVQGGSAAKTFKCVSGSMLFDRV